MELLDDDDDEEEEEEKKKKIPYLGSTIPYL